MSQCDLCNRETSDGTYLFDGHGIDVLWVCAHCNPRDLSASYRLTFDVNVGHYVVREGLRQTPIKPLNRV